MKEYHTAQRKCLLEVFKSNKEKALSIDEVMTEIPEALQISRSAVYRNVDKMVTDGLLQKTMDSQKRKSMYQFVTCGKHCDRIHLKCEKCGRMFHMESREAEEKLSGILESTGFKLDEHATTLVGVCNECKNGDKDDINEE